MGGRRGQFQDIPQLHQGGVQIRVLTVHRQVNRHFLNKVLFLLISNNARRLCGCTPWNYPHPPGEVEEVCDLMGGTCFEKVRKRQFIQKKRPKNKTFPPFQALHDSSRLPSASRSRLCPYLEPCLPDCEHLELTSYEYVIPTDAERLCMDRESPFRFRSQNFFLSV